VQFALALEFVTQGLARATSHRVLSPAKGSTPRYSVPFFQNISLNVRLSDEVLQCTFSSLLYLSCTVDLLKSAVPPDVLKLKDDRGAAAGTDCTCDGGSLILVPLNLYLLAVNFTEFDREPSGRVNLIGRVK